MSCQLSIDLLIHFVKNEVDQVKTRKQRRWQVDVLGNWQVWVISGLNRIGRSQNGGSCIQSGNDTSFCNRNGLLFHDFVQDRSCGVRHLIELINTAHTSVRQNQSSTFQHQLLGFNISGNVCSQTNSRGTFTGGVNTSRSDLVNIL
ncbi:hypothetical protein OGAPHI_007022 [Ogataea philodendri]|uniref:Uncharacterized protein n=1 Tax=Ogataea philodendri TaxID=1378263 RepID=A0A9P8SZI0_9ASCO|nr:uncharacterized protein OGAPHI_007022 [Ogataea philodendri]KAH3660436.1 hypothetical protein OGAPHI_007022 [Ogataea philodendri]